jgi:multiple sugar transport system ATP-binding protein
MNGGRIVQVGPPLEVYKHPANTFVASFLGNPPMNLLPARIAGANGGLVVELGQGTIELKSARYPRLSAGAAVTLGIRPESIAEHANTANSDRFVRVEAEIVQVESLGAETIIAARIAGVADDVMARISPESDMAVGERRVLSLDLSAMHLFDAAGNSMTANASLPR